MGYGLFCFTCNVFIVFLLPVILLSKPTWISRHRILKSLLLMLLWNQIRHRACKGRPLFQMTQQLSNGASNGADESRFGGTTLAELPKSNVFTENLPADDKFPRPADSHKASRPELGPRMVKGALFTYVRPEEKEDTELYGVSEMAMRDIGLKPGEEKTQEFQQLVSGNKILWDPKTETGIYPWAQCYGGKLPNCEEGMRLS